MLRALSCALFRWRGACYNKVGGTLLTNGIPATPIDAFVGEVMAPTLADAKKPGRSTNDNRGVAHSVPALELRPLGARHLAASCAPPDAPRPRRSRRPDEKPRAVGRPTAKIAAAAADRSARPGSTKRSSRRRRSVPAARPGSGCGRALMTPCAPRLQERRGSAIKPLGRFPKG
jgi:hypothetical protein